MDTLAPPRHGLDRRPRIPTRAETLEFGEKVMELQSHLRELQRAIDDLLYAPREAA